MFGADHVSDGVANLIPFLFRAFWIFVILGYFVWLQDIVWVACTDAGANSKTI